jgi:hypothetical protein
VENMFVFVSKALSLRFSHTQNFPETFEPTKYTLNSLHPFQQDDHQIATVFGFQGITPQELRRMSPFRTHVCKFQRFMTTVLDMLPKRNREEELIQILRYTIDHSL